MKIIDLLNKIANGEELPSKIKIGGEQILTLNDSKDNYLYKYEDEYYGKCLIHWFCLNEEVEIIEEEKKIPEKIEIYKENNEMFLENFCYKNLPIHKDSLSLNEQVIVDKLNEVIDYLKSKGDE